MPKMAILIDENTKVVCRSYAGDDRCLFGQGANAEGADQ